MTGQGGVGGWEVSNQVPVLADYDAFAADPVLPGIVAAFGADWARERLHEAGRTVGSPEDDAQRRTGAAIDRAAGWRLVRAIRRSATGRRCGSAGATAMPAH
ncbi:hypothetical protein [Bosea beijingensis]|uniref:hypothetical protein n=1 Tax=Bosea beijingensis TaxID=3068632 RepID=UPI0027404C86|nr:hypothetical protein [Bosea sp. REN20]